MSERQQLMTAWLQARYPEREGIELSGFKTPEAGASNETLLFDMQWHTGAQPMVARLQPTKDGVFPEYNLALQYRTMDRLKSSAVRVPLVSDFEEDPGVLGTPFYLMERLQGRYLADNPPYQMEGWLTEMPAEDCGNIWRNGISQMAAVARVDWQARDFADLWNSLEFATPLAEILAYYENFLGWAENLGRPFPKLYPVLEYLKNNQPQQEPITLCWGDAKPPNLMIDGTQISGLLDWEMVHLGNPVHDLSWWFVLDDSLTDGLGLPKVDGLPSRDEMINQWESESGFSAAQLDYYELLSTFQFAVIMHRVGTRLTAAGIFTAEMEFDLNNNCTPLLDRQIGKYGLAT